MERSFMQMAMKSTKNYDGKIIERVAVIQELKVLGISR